MFYHFPFSYQTSPAGKVQYALYDTSGRQDSRAAFETYESAAR